MHELISWAHWYSSCDHFSSFLIRCRYITYFMLYSTIWTLFRLQHTFDYLVIFFEVNKNSISWRFAQSNIYGTTLFIAVSDLCFATSFTYCNWNFFKRRYWIKRIKKKPSTMETTMKLGSRNREISIFN